MRLNKFFVNKSIKFRMMSIFIVIIITVVIGLGASIINQRLVTKEFNRFVDYNTSLSVLPIKINESSASFEKYLRERTIFDLSEHNSKNVEITKILQSIRHDLGDDPDNLIYYRTLTNMHEYQQELTQELLAYNRFDPGMYEQITYLRTLYSYMNRQAQMLSMSYLDYSSSEYIATLDKSTDRVNKIYFVIIVFSFLSIITAMILSMDLLATLDKVSNTANSLSNGKFDIPDLEANDFVELNTVANTLNNMKKDIKEYILELSEKAEIELQLNKEKLTNVEKDKLLKEAELLTLQMQMNPHFLFNTLNMIGRTAMFEDTDNTVKLIESISEILRYNLDNKGKLVPLEKELSVLEAYIYIQQMRFQERIAFSLEVTSEIKQQIRNINIPPMIFQPIVENAIIHGLKDTVKAGQVDIKLIKEDSSLKVVISDNGVGISEEIISQILNNQQPIKEGVNKTSNGILNVKKRLELNYEQDDLLKIDSQLGQGTAITLIIPC
ncbi:MAG: histidine kinase [Bacillota bacterium]|nr:histidine kinase [Bacillota bacterium]